VRAARRRTSSPHLRSSASSRRHERPAAPTPVGCLSLAPVVIEARQLVDDLRSHTQVANWINANGGTAEVPFAEPCIFILTLEGRMRADIGDWIIKGVQGEFYIASVKR
jgi:hypothetical protein